MSEEKKLDQSEENGVKSGIDTGLVVVDISKEVKSSFLDYSMSVIVSRAIPDVYDGLKPVHRRIIYGMNELGITPDKPYKKSARIVGDVMGKYHPHGDSAIYDSLVRLAQPFSMRLPLVDGHGNFGSIDGDQAAAQRYTEARMNKLDMEMVRDINAETVDFVDNYDGAEKEPVVLPSRFPNLLVNGSSGIAVGMATNIPPHNLKEVISALKAVVRNPEITVLELMQKHISGPDFPTGGLILGQGGIRKAYETGSGIISIRGKTEIRTLSNGKNQIIITEIPYQVNKANMVEAIAILVKDKVIDGITDIRDESNKDGIKVVIELRKEKVPEVVLNQLYKHSQLQVTFGIINLALIKGQPKIMSLIEMLNYYMEHQTNVITRRTKYYLSKALDRVHIVDGYIVSIENIDEVVKIIRGSQLVEEARKSLAERFALSDRQTREIVDMPLRRLVGLEINKLKEEKIDLEAKIKYYNELLASPEKIKDTIIGELEEISAQFGDERRTEISDDISTIDDEDLIPKEEIVVTLTTEGYIKRMAPGDFQAQNRGGRGKRGLTTKENDVVQLLVHARTHTDLLFFSNLGKVYRIRGYQVPLYSRSAKGLPINNVLNLDKDERIRSIITVDEYSDGHYLFFVTTKGIVKKTAVRDFASIRQNGKIAISLNDGDHLLDVKHTDGNQLIGIANNNGKLVKFNENDVRSMGRTAAGVKGMNVDGGEAVSVTTSDEGDQILVVSEKGLGKISPADEYRLTKRGAKGVLTVKTTERTGKLVSMRAVKGNEDLLIITTSGTIIRIPVEQIKQSSRVTQGVIIVRPDEGHAVQDIALLPYEEIIGETAEEEPEEDN